MPPAQKARPVVDFLKTVPVARVREILKHFAPVGTETVGVENATARVVASNTKSPVNMPHFPRAGMDGYALKAADTLRASRGRPVLLQLVGAVEMGKKPRFKVQSRTAARISTGGMMPAGADAMVMREYCLERDGGTVAVYKRINRGDNVIVVGEDVRKGEKIFQAGRRLRAQDLGALTGVGITKIHVYRKPRVAVIATGDEIVPPKVKPKPGQVRDINHYSLRAMIESSGGIAIDFGVIKDDIRAISRAVGQALARADLVTVSGGSSVGTKDLTLQVIANLPGAQVLVHGVAIKPGKPTILASARGRPIIGLPGHPVSALVIFGLFALPLLRILGGENPELALRPKATLRARLSSDIRAVTDRDSYVRVGLRPEGEMWVATPLKGGSSAIFSLARADGMVLVPLGGKGLKAGAEVEVSVFC